MSESRFYVAPLGPFAIVERLLNTVKEVAPGTRIQGLTMHTPHGKVPFVNSPIPVSDLPAYEPFREAWESVKNADFLHIYAINTATADGWTLNYNNQEPAEGPYISLKFDPPRAELDVKRAVKIGEALQHNFPLVHKAERGALRLPEGQLEAFRFAEATIGQFATEAAKLSQSTSKNFEEFSKLLREKTSEPLTSDMAKRRQNSMHDTSRSSKILRPEKPPMLRTLNSSN